MSSVKMEGFDKWMEGLADQAEKFLIRRTAAAGLVNLNPNHTDPAIVPAQRSSNRVSAVPKLTFSFQVRFEAISVCEQCWTYAILLMISRQ